MSEEIQKQGANARALGISRFDNPYAKSAAMPAATGESIDEWQAKFTAWKLGWDIENAMRPDPALALLRALASDPLLDRQGDSPSPPSVV